MPAEKSSSGVMPLDKMEISDSSTGKFPALDPHWASKSRFLIYLPPPEDAGDQGAMGEWMERLQYLRTDLHWLLQLSHHKFWCQVIFDDCLHQVLDSFLRFSPRWHDLHCELPDEAQSLHNQVTRLIFLTYVRMSTHKESKDSFLTPEVFGEIIYQNFLFDIPKILDLCALYGHNNTELLSKMVGNVFKQQHLYLEDLDKAIPTFLQVFDSICMKCGLDGDRSPAVPQKLGGAGDRAIDLVTMESSEFQDILFYLADTAVTLAAFLTVYPPACAMLQQLFFCQQLAHTYERLIPAFQSSLKLRQFDSTWQKKMVRNKLRLARTHLLSTFHFTLDHTCLQPVIAHSSDSDLVNKHVEQFLATMSSVLGEKRFLADYEVQFSFQDDLDVISQCSSDITHYKYIQDAINSAFAAYGKRKTPKGNTNRGGRTSPDGSPCPPSAQHGTVSSTTKAAEKNSAAVATHGQPEGASAAVPSEVELDSMICAVQDLLPHLGSGFIQRALEELGYNPEQVVSAVLENNLPLSLEHLDFTLERTQREAESREPATLDTRYNIYDNDQFDVFHNSTVDVERIHRGKRDNTITLNDKDSIKGLRSLYDAYGSMDVLSMYDRQMYDDEYDDTYDSSNIGADDADSADELTQRRPFTVPQVLRQAGKAPSDDSDSSQEEQQDVPQDSFLQDPAKLRALQEQKRASRQLNTHANRDVKGRARGQGQSDEVLRNRRFKEKTKSTRSNHNRRVLADKKMSKGMI